MKLITTLLGLAMLVSGTAQGAAFMDADWATKACEEWNNSTTLTEGLAGDSWAANNAGRGYKIIHLYREKCGPDSAVELEISDKDGKAMCTYGGAIKHTELDPKVDYLMHAEDDDWTCMGEGKWGCGAMGAMMTGKLKFVGPKGEAMGVMGPFGDFLVLTGKVPGDKAECP